MQKTGVRWTGASDGDTEQPPSPPVSLLSTVANQAVEQQFWGEGAGRDTVVTGEQEEPAIATLWT
jgi:hypothetical protein